MVHEKLRPWTCEECNKSFSDRRDLIAGKTSLKEIKDKSATAKFA